MNSMSASTNRRKFQDRLFLIVSLGFCGLLSGCTSFSTSTQAPTLLAGSALKGSLHGGQQPIAGASIYLYAAGTGGYGAATQNLLTSPVTTNFGGGFSFPGNYSCTAGQQLYIVAIGGNPGAGNNPNAAELAVLGDCANLTASTFINMTEVTTVAGVYALAPFMSGYAAVGSSAGNTVGLQRAAISASKLANLSTGLAGGPALAPGAVLPVAEINSLADIVASCINSTGGTAGDNSPCGNLFAATTAQNSTAPTDTIGALLAIAKHPTANVAALQALVSSTGPYQPTLTVAPNDWTLSINYSLGGFNSPQSATVDGKGQIWFANAGNSTMTVLSQTGAPLPLLSGNGLQGPAAVAIDQGGNAWVANQKGNSLSVFTASGAVFAGSPFGGGGNLNGPVALAFDAPGNLWIANNASNSVTELGASGTFVRQITTGVNAPTALAVDPK